MIDYRPLQEVINGKGLRIVLVQGLPSPWGQAAKTILDIKGLDYIVGSQLMGEENNELVAWSGQRGAPVMVWNDEKPVHNWIDILYLAERLAPTPSLIPSDPLTRALMFGISHELLGQMGLLWHRRLQMFSPAIESGKAPAGVVRMAKSYSYNARDTELSGTRMAASLRMLSAQVNAQYARDVRYLVGDSLSAADIYWVAASNILQPLPKENCPIPDKFRPTFVATDPLVTSALDPILLEHRNKIFAECFRNPMEF